MNLLLIIKFKIIFNWVSDEFSVCTRGTKTSASHRLQHFPEYKLILNQTGRCGVMNAENKKMTICPRHCHQFTRLQELSGQRQHPLHKGEIKFQN